MISSLSRVDSSWNILVISTEEAKNVKLQKYSGNFLSSTWINQSWSQTKLNTENRSAHSYIKLRFDKSWNCGFWEWWVRLLKYFKSKDDQCDSGCQKTLCLDVSCYYVFEIIVCFLFFTVFSFWNDTLNFLTSKNKSLLYGL